MSSLAGGSGAGNVVLQGCRAGIGFELEGGLWQLSLSLLRVGVGLAAALNSLCILDLLLALPFLLEKNVFITPWHSQEWLCCSGICAFPDSRKIHSHPQEFSFGAFSSRASGLSHQPLTSSRFLDVTVR